MANDRVDIDLDVNDRGVNRTFRTLETSSARAASKVSSNFSSGLDLSMRRFVANATTRLLGLSAALSSLLGIGVIAKGIKELDKSFTEIKTIIPDVTQANEELRQSLIRTSSQFGTSAADQAKSFYQIISAGITDAAAANEVLIASNKLAIGGLTDVTTSVDILTSAINAYGAENLKAETASDILFGTVRLGKTRVEELAGSLGQILPSAAALKVSFEDVSGAIAALTTRGISTSEAVTQLNAVLTAVLKKQDEAKKLGPQVAEAFSLQALQTKGLTRFLFDLNFALGGSERALVKLLGRAEGARAIITLAGDNFKTLANNVDQLRDSSGATEEAFQKVNNTIGQQLNVLGSTITNIFTNISESSNKAVVDFLKDLVKLAETIGKNLDTIVSAFATATKFFASFLIATRLAPAIFKTTAISLKFLRNEASIFTTRVGLAKLSLIEFGATLRGLSLKSAITGFKRLITGIKGTRIALGAARVAANLFKASLTFGISLAIDFLLIKFLELKEQFGGFGNLVKFTVLEIRRNFNELALSSVRLVQKMKNLPVLGDRFQSAFSNGLLLAESESVVAINNINKEIDSLAQQVFDSTTEIDFTSMEDKFKKVNEKAKFDFSFDKEQFDKNKKTIEDGLDGLSNAAEEASRRITEAIRNGLGNALAAGVEGFTNALLKGGNAFQAFANGVLAVFGDLAIQLGKFFIIQGIAIEALNSISGTGAIVAGIALVALGTILKSFASGGGAGGAAPGSAVTPPLIDLEPGRTLEPQFQQPQAQVQVTIEGNVFDSEETGLRIADILKDQGFNNAVVS